MVQKTLVACCIVLLALISVKPAQVFASSQLVVQQNSDVMYVTTQASPSGNNTSSVSITESTSTNSSDILQTPITTQRGYVSDIGNLINFVLRLILIIGAVLVFAYLILGGFQYITSGGEKGKVEAARNKIMAAIIGLLILAASWAVLTLTLRLLGFKDLNDAINSVGTINETATSSASITASSSSTLRNADLVP